MAFTQNPNSYNKRHYGSALLFWKCLWKCPGLSANNATRRRQITAPNLDARPEPQEFLGLNRSNSLWSATRDHVFTHARPSKTSVKLNTKIAMSWLDIEEESDHFPRVSADVNTTLKCQHQQSLIESVATVSSTSFCLSHTHKAMRNYCFKWLLLSLATLYPTQETPGATGHALWNTRICGPPHKVCGSVVAHERLHLWEY